MDDSSQADMNSSHRQYHVSCSYYRAAQCAYIVESVIVLLTCAWFSMGPATSTDCSSQGKVRNKPVSILEHPWPFLKYQKIGFPPWDICARWPWEYAAVTDGVPYGLVAVFIAAVYLVFIHIIYPHRRESGEGSSLDQTTVADHVHLDSLKKRWDGPYPFQVFATLMAFLMVFRCVVCFLLQVVCLQTV